MGTLFRPMAILSSLWTTSLKWLGLEFNSLQAFLACLSSSRLLLLLALIPSLSFREDVLRRERNDRTLRIIEAGSRPPQNREASVGKQAAIMDIWGSIKDQISSSVIISALN